jgi:phage shock protein A
MSDTDDLHSEGKTVDELQELVKRCFYLATRGKTVTIGQSEGMEKCERLATPELVRAIQKLLAQERAEAEIEARIDELEQLDSLTHSFMSLGSDFEYSYRQSAVDDRIAELKAKEQRTHEN